MKSIEPLKSLPKLEVVDFGTNFIKITNLSILTELQSFKIINLADNKISSPSDGALDLSLAEFEGWSPMSSAIEYDSGDVREIHYFRFDEYARSCKHKDKELGTVTSLVDKRCSKFGKTLDVSRNNIFFLHSRFLNLKELRCLNLSSNLMSQSLNGSEFSNLPNLQYLDFSSNRLDLLYPTAFQELQNLVILDISHNSHYFESEGLTHMLNFTKNLKKLTTLLMNNNQISTSTNTELDSESLERLEFRRNRLDIMWRDGDTRYVHYFKKLVNLKVLDISHNNLRSLPPELFVGLPGKLSELYLKGNGLKSFNWKELQHLRSLQVLDLSGNSLTTVPRVLFVKWLNETKVTIPKLGTEVKCVLPEAQKDNLVISVNLSACQHNSLSIILYTLMTSFILCCITLPVSSHLFLWDVWYIYHFCRAKLKGYRRLSSPSSVYDAFVIYDKEDSAVIEWVMKEMCVQLERRGDCKLTCAWRRETGYLDVLSSITCPKASIRATGLFFIFLFIFVTMAAHLFYWDAFYILYFLKAKLKGYSPLHSPESAYDVFIAYDTQDPYVSKWVMEKLLVKLEGEGDKHHPLCLEERDWFPGTPLLDNLSHSIRNSRKTLFVLTEDYVKTGMFKMAMYLAHQRLLDENVDVILVLMLEPVLQHSHFLRLRKRLCDKSVLEWPKTRAAQSWFWQNLKNIIRVNNEVLYNKTYISYFTNR
ncbi:hypothetical protein WMY93_002545 [Mugilogobius chulae]|uniref:TIR domain-containing protein n=1 Tax=Mugilogobius chulae TaxID=88201 RepID=A0AAW0PWX5_9GOBI